MNTRLMTQLQHDLAVRSKLVLEMIDGVEVGLLPCSDIGMLELRLLELESISKHMRKLIDKHTKA